MGRVGAAGRALAAAGVGLAVVLIVAGAWQVVRAVPAWRDDRATFAAMVAGHPQNPEGQAVWAQVLATEGRAEEAERHLQEARRLWPGLPRADLSESWLELYRSHWAAALRLVDRALAADSSLDDGFLVRGKALMELGRLDEAEAMLAPVVRRNPGVLPIEGEWGRFLLLRGRSAAALPYLERAAADASLARNPDLSYELGLAHAELGRLPEASADLERALALDPRFYDALLRLAQVRSALGDGAGRDAALARAAALPQSSDGRVETLRRQLAALPAGLNRERPTR